MKKNLLIILFMTGILAASAQNPVYRMLPAGHILYGMSSSGNFAAGTNGQGAFLYKSSDSSITNLGGEAGYGVNNFGVVCGSFLDPNVTYNGAPCEAAGTNTAGTWTGTGYVGSVATVQTGYSYAYDIADDGITVCGMYWLNAGSTDAFIYNSSFGYTVLSDLGSSARANYISDDGLVAAGWWQDATRVPVRWDPAPVALSGGEAYGLNYNGTVMVGADNGLPFVWDTSGNVVTVPIPATANDGAATGITDNGIVVGYYTSGTFPPFPRTAFIHIPGQGTIDLSTFLVNLGVANVGNPGTPIGISRDGRYIVGNASGFPTSGFFIDLGSPLTSIQNPVNEFLTLSVYPNPSVSGPVSFKFDANQAGAATLRIVDTQGRLVKELNDSQVQSGSNTILWDRKDVNGADVSAGNYVGLLEQGGRSMKVLLVLL